MTDSVSVERTIEAPAEKVWSLISDVTRMCDWSPETTACEWVGGASGPEIGAKFKGRNAHGKRSWTTTCTVTDADPGRSFGFLVKAGPIQIARWLYLIEPADGGCRVEERWTDRRGNWVKKLGGVASGVKERPEHNRRTMETTLERLADAAESA